MSNVLVINKNVADFRAANGLNDTECVRLKELLKKLNVITIFKKLDGDFAGMAFKQEDHRFMMVNSEHTVGKQNFTICHELYHLFIQENFTSMTCKTEIFDKKDKVEFYADSFAAKLLFPEEGLLQHISPGELKKDKITISTIVNIENYFQCSRISLLHRLEEMGLLSPQLKEEYARDVMRSARECGFTDDLYKQGNEGLFIGEAYIKTIQHLYDNKHISLSHYLGMMEDVGIEKY